MQETYSHQALVDSLSAGAVITEENGARIEQRDAADRQRGRLDPRTAAAYALTRQAFATPGAVHPQLAANYDRLLGPPQPQRYDALALIRYTFGWRSTDLSRGVATKRHVLHTGKRPFCLLEYRPQNAAPGAPALIFIHGGAFVAGDVETVENQCKLLAQLSGGVVFSVDYPLAPENPFPEGYNACRAALEHVCQNAGALGINPGNIGVAGDSAGGNLALNLSAQERNEGTRRIAWQGLIYPGLAMAQGKADAFYHWDAGVYENPDNDPVIAQQIRLIGQTGDLAEGWYLEDADQRDDARVSPILHGCQGLPNTLLMYAEYDYLRVGCDAYAAMLQKAGVPGKAIRYGGITHGTFDRLGYAPQVEDMLREMALMMTGG